jgi:hypothetical protein
MKLPELKRIVDSAMAHWSGEELEVCIAVKEEGYIGGKPLVKVYSAGKGIDWDNKKFIIWPEKDLKKVEKIENNG